jgi:MFS family permease
VLAQVTSLGVPFLVRAGVLLVMFVVAFRLMVDLGFTPRKMHRPLHEAREVLNASLQHGLGNRPVRWVMLSGLFSYGVAIYVFYALQPYLLDLYGDPTAYSIAGLAAAIVAGAQIVGGLAAPRVRARFQRRTSVLMLTTAMTAAILVLLWATHVFWLALLLLAVWAIVGAAGTPVRQAYLNDMIPSQPRATVLSFDSLVGNSGAVVVQPALGRVADVSGYAASLAVAAGIQIVAVPFLLASRREASPADLAQLADGRSA